MGVTGNIFEMKVKEDPGRSQVYEWSTEMQTMLHHFYQGLKDYFSIHEERFFDNGFDCDSRSRLKKYIYEPLHLSDLHDMRNILQSVLPHYQQVYSEAVTNLQERKESQGKVYDLGKEQGDALMVHIREVELGRVQRALDSIAEIITPRKPAEIRSIFSAPVLDN